ncbi:glycosyltransferase family 39 protein [Cucurbitaria berberidis CBS 394.84]|uniref:Dolichyl-phosphate-mannose--protein mannosyltransferase 4 n=1 Tax=Cucurbitaria berberidis CBS 394.84 TaxID=1168544 RepID=A0A9P4L5T1_9PLEO|nr:glycosyltransferase family 39 protein [Cucurbitaria berberidis CBS 394.84]KAF1842647.1 glycosyltransferase family 39 protein [Cucurbitaria berberidis CBS 394.84]
MAAFAPVVSSFSLIFGGCCANVYCLEAIVKQEPDSGLLITLFQFVFTCLSTLHYQFDLKGRYFVRSSPVPFQKWCVSAALFFTVNMLNNWAFAFNISVPVHIILRSFGSVTTMAAGWLRGKRFTRLQVFSVAVLTLGVMVSAWADAQSKGKTMETSNIDFASASFEAGLLILLVAQLLSAYMGAYVEDVYRDHGKDWQANLFYSHLLSLPLFAGFAPVLTGQFTRLQASQSFQVPPNIATSLPPILNKILASTSQQVIYLTANAVTQLLCITGVNMLSANTSAVTVTIVLNIRKLVSFLLSISIFGNQMAGLMKVGAAMVFGAGALYGWETSYRIPQRKKIEAEKVKPTMSSSPSGVRQRATKDKKRPTTPNSETLSEKVANVIEKTKPYKPLQQGKEWDYKLAITVLTVLAFISRFWGITHPDQVVFDEVHFGKFASYYLQRTYFFDVHPPLGKLLFAFAGWLVGYRGEFLFENIGDSYITNKVPYVAYRAMPASLGALTVPIVFLIMWESGYSLPACVTAASLMLLDNAHIGQTRLILLDASLIFFMALSVLSYIRFYKQRHDPFSRKWWKWLLLTGISLSCVISIKYVGVFTFFSVGVPVLIDLWDLMDVNRRQGALTLAEFGKHFAARAIGLVIVPFFLYLFWFQVHFSILTRSGPGDDFMTPEFQETLSDNMMSLQSVGINYYDSITIRHKETKVYLHSHPDRYPLRYDDGRVSSQGQQVTGYPHNDTNNHWQVLPSKPLPTELGQRVKVGDTIRLRHLITDTVLLTHDVASPYYPTNQEFTAVNKEEAAGERYNDTLFELKVDKGKGDFRTMSTHFKLVHVPTKVAMWTHTSPLPEWAYKQAEINGNKNVQQSSNVWYVDDIPSLPVEDERNKKEPKQVKHLSFLRKWVELQRAMFYHNNALTSSHPYASQPISWPFLLRGVSFWTHNDTREQIYFLGNPIGWWLASSLLAVFVGILGADQLALRRGMDALDERTRSRLYNSTGFFFLTWAAHYIPFYIMGRQLFLHHYLPAHLASCLVTGALVEFIFCIEPQDTETPAIKGHRRTRSRPVRERVATTSQMGSWIATGVILVVVSWSFLFFAPLTYGKPGLTVSQVQARKWLGYDLHFAK